MISFDYGNLIHLLYAILLLASFAVNLVWRNKYTKSHLIIIALLIFEAGISKYLANNSVLTFYDFYLVSAGESNAVIALGVFLHIILNQRHSDNSYIVYVLTTIKVLSYLLIHQIRVETVSTDDNIIWLLNTHTIIIGVASIASATVLMLEGRNNWLYSIYLRCLYVSQRFVLSVKKKGN